MSIEAVLFAGVAGTGAAKRTAEWNDVDSLLSVYLRERGIENIAGQALSPFLWSTDLNGIGAKNQEDWKATGRALFYYFVPQLRPELAIRPCRSNVICHSHGLQGVLFACAYGLKLNALISVGSPVRKDMEAVAKLARPNIARWLHIHSDGSDRWQWLGELFDGHFGIVREHPLADKNVAVAGVGHAGVLRDPADFPLWDTGGWIEFFKGVGPLTSPSK